MKINLVGISGHSGSGKDTVGEMIKFILSGTIKNPSYANYKYFRMFSIYTRKQFEIKKFATGVKEIGGLLLNTSPKSFESHEFKDSPSSLYSDKNNRDILIGIAEGLKERINKNIWLDQVFKNYDPDKSKWIITDVRFENEVEKIKKERGVILYKEH